MAEKQFHKGWLYERDGVKFAPYTLKESIVDRNGKTWADSVDSKLNDLASELNSSSDGLQASVSLLVDRTTTLENRTQYLDASDDGTGTFYITDENGNVALKVDENGATSFDFITSKTNLNNLYERTNDLENAVVTINGTSLVNLQNQIVQLQKHTQYLNASNDDANTFYITDEYGNVAAKINADGITSFNFISQGVTDLNSLYQELLQHNINIIDLTSALQSIKDILTSDIQKLQTRTKYLNASDDNAKAFYITDDEGNIAMKVDTQGVTSFNFISQGITDLNTLSQDVDKAEKAIDDAETAINDLSNVVVANKQAIEADVIKLSNRVTQTEIRTQYVNASDDEAKVFYITDGSGNVAMKVDENGVESFEFIVGDTKVKETLDSLIKKDNELGNAITSLETNLNKKIDTTESELNATIQDTKSELNTAIQVNRQQLDQTIAILKQNLDSTDSELSAGIAVASGRLEKLEQRTRYVDASDNEAKAFYVTDENGNVGMKVDESGVTSFDFIIPKKENEDKAVSLSGIDAALKQEIADRVANNQALINKDAELSGKIKLNTDNISNLQSRMSTAESDITTLQSDRATKKELADNVALLTKDIGKNASDITNLQGKDSEHDNALNNLTERTQKIEIRTQYIDGTANNTFDIVDENGNVGMRVDENGVLAQKIFIRTTKNTNLPVIGYQKVSTIEI